MGIPEKRKKNRKKMAAAVIVILLMAAVLAGYFALHYAQKRKARLTSGVSSGAGVSAEDEDAVTYRGTRYVYNDHLSNFLFMGIDKREKADTKVGQADAGQADAIFMISWDRVEHSLTLISIPRDTMT